MKRFCLFVLLLSTLTAAPVSQATTEPAGQTRYAGTITQADDQHNPIVLRLEGNISRGMLGVVNKTLPDKKTQTVLNVPIVLLDSPGGDGLAAMAIGEKLRQANAHVFVTGQCASACVFLLAAGVVRSADAYTVGLHRGRVTVSRADGSVKKELSAEQDSKTQAFLRDFETKALAYFARMGMSPELFKTMQRFERRTVYRLNNEELRRFNLVGVDGKYFASGTNTRDFLGDGQALSVEEFNRRVSRTSSRCGMHEAEDAAFWNCYRDNLNDLY